MKSHSSVIFKSKMVSKIFLVVFSQLLILKVTTSYAPPYSKKQYMHHETRPPNPRQVAYASQSYSPSNSYPKYQRSTEYVIPTYQRSPEYGTPYERYVEFVPASYQRPTEVIHQVHQTPSELSSIPETESIARSNVPLPPTKLETLSPKVNPESDTEHTKKCSKTLDSNVLNNLAIALQLLIVSNIINSPRSDPAEVEAYFDKSLIDLASKGVNPLNVQSNFQMPNSKFLCSSNFGDDMSKTMMGLGSLGTGMPLPRPGVTLMSPYDSIALNSPYADSVSPVLTTKNDFQSPYAAILAADRDKSLFSMSDYY